MAVTTQPRRGCDATLQGAAMRTADEILADIAAVRQKTIETYVVLSGLTDAAALGWKVRAPGQVDVTLELIRHALRDAPVETRRLLQIIADNDLVVVRLTRELAS